MVNRLFANNRALAIDIGLIENRVRAISLLVVIALAIDIGLIENRVRAISLLVVIALAIDIGLIENRVRAIIESVKYIFDPPQPPFLRGEPEIFARPPF